MKENKQFKVLISAGHGGSDCGAVVGNSKEAEFARWVRNSVATDLSNFKSTYSKYDIYEIITDGSHFENAPLKEAIELAKESDIAVEFHFNAFKDKQAHGVEVIAAPENKKFAQNLCKAINDVSGIEIRGDEKGYKPVSASQHSRLGFVEAGGVIIEICFMTNENDMAAFSDNFSFITRILALTIHEEVYKKLR